MRQLSGLLAVAATLGLAACGSGQITVQSSVERADGSTTGLEGLLVRVLPYDRDAIFTELERAYGIPEPTVPDSLKALQDAIARAQGEWTTAEAIWNAARDSLKVLSDRMAVMDRTSAPYALAYRDFIAQEAVVQRAEQVSKSAYGRFEELNRRHSQQTDSVRLAWAEWEETAFAGADSAIRERVSASGLTEQADTTDGNGVATFATVRKGKYWIHARQELPYEDLYWNIPVEVAGEPVTVQLNRQSAQVRPRL
jgi:hypothetical protein